MKLFIFSIPKLFFTGLFFLLTQQCISQKNKDKDQKSVGSQNHKKDKVYINDGFSQGIKLSLTDNNENTSDIIKSNNILREEVYGFYFHNNKIKDSSLIKIIYYDTMGRISEIHDPNSEALSENDHIESSITTYSYKYNEEGKLIKKVSDNPGLFGQLNIEYEYDSVGNTIFIYYYNKDTTNLKIERRIYNSKQQIEKVFTKMGNGEFYNSSQYFYDETGALSIESIVDSKGVIVFSHYYVNSELPNKKSVYVEMNNIRSLKSEIFYDNYKRRIKENSNPKEELLNDSQVTDYQKFLDVSEYNYNKDNTFFQCTSYFGGKKNQLSRHYYFRK